MYLWQLNFNNWTQTYSFILQHDETKLLMNRQALNYNKQGIRQRTEIGFKRPSHEN